MKVLAKSFFMGFNLITNKNALAKYKGVGMNINVNEVLLQNKKKTVIIVCNRGVRLLRYALS